jgi:hypothetical protein
MKPITPNTPVPEKFPRLSKTLKPFRDLDICQQCGSQSLVTRWQECDDNDKPQAIIVYLCKGCSRVIEPHPRLYKSMGPFEPFPGTMKICVDCKFRDKAHCKHPRSVWNGGHGLKVAIEKPSVAFLRPGGMKFLFHSAATGCDGKEKVS